MEGSFYKIISGSHNRKLASQKGVEWYIRGIERKKKNYQKNTSDNTTPQKLNRS